MNKKNKHVKKSKENVVKSSDKVALQSDNYGYDFVAELNHFTNIDEQRKNAKKLEKL